MRYFFYGHHFVFSNSIVDEVVKFPSRGIESALEGEQGDGVKYIRKLTLRKVSCFLYFKWGSSLKVDKKLFGDCFSKFKIKIEACNCYRRSMNPSTSKRTVLQRTPFLFFIIKMNIFIGLFQGCVAWAMASIKSV